MKNLIIFLLVVTVGILPAFCEKVGTLNISSKTVFVKQNKKVPFTRVSGKSDLHNGTTIKTGINGTAFVKYPDIAEININKNTIVRFGKSVIHMTIGRASYKFIKKGHKFSVKLPVAIIGVLGTEFDIEVKKDRSCSVKMKKGIISLKTRKGKIKVEKNNIAFISPDGDVKVKKIIPSMIPFKMTKKVEKPVIEEVEEVEEEIVYEEEEKTAEEVKEPSAKSKIVAYEMIGDLDRDGRITNFDTSILNKYIDKVDLTEQQKRLADVDGNGKIDSNDAMKMQIYLEYKVDLNADGKLNQQDVQILKEVVKYQENKLPCDINHDGKIDSFDINELKMIVEQLNGCLIGQKK